MTNENQPNQDIEKLKATLRGLSMTQIRFVIARLENKTDKAAAEEIGISPATVKSWDNKMQVDDAVDLMRVDGMITALEIRRRNLAKAMAVKAAGLDSDDEKIRQNVATEIIEWETGKASQPLTGANGSPLIPPVEKTDNELRDSLAEFANILLANAGRTVVPQSAGTSAQDDTSGEGQ